MKKSPPPTPPVPPKARCQFSGSQSWMIPCSNRAEIVLAHIEFGEDEPQYCIAHIGFALAELIEPGCGIDEVIIMRTST